MTVTKICMPLSHKLGVEQKAKRPLKSVGCGLCARPGPGEPQSQVCLLDIGHMTNALVSPSDYKGRGSEC